MRLQPIIVAGWKNSGPGHWQTLWADSLPHALRIQQVDWDHPDPAAWLATLSNAICQACSPVLLIAHSLGCLSCASLSAALHSKVAGALLVAPPDIERPTAPSELRHFAPIKRQPLAFQSVVVASDNDPYCDLERARGFAQDWGSRLVILPQAGHINADSGLDDWPQGLKLLGALRRRAAWRVAAPAERIPAVADPCLAAIAQNTTRS